LHQLLVDLHLENGNAAEALPHAVAVSLLDWTPQTIEITAECARLTGNLALAERAFLAAIERRQAQGVPHWGPHYLLGNLYLEHNAFDRAEVELRRAVELNAAAWQPLYSLASVLLETGRPSEAERVLANANTLAPAEPQPALRLAKLLQGSGRTTEAMILAYKAFENTAPEGGRGTPQLREEALSLLRILSEKTQPSRPN
jgi:Flp pilus assembly protein TadD